jgi:hypothetical protein
VAEAHGMQAGLLDSPGPSASPAASVQNALSLLSPRERS